MKEYYDDKGNRIGYSIDWDAEHKEWERKQEEYKAAHPTTPWDLNDPDDAMKYFAQTMRWVVFQVILVLSIIPHFIGSTHPWADTWEVFYRLFIYFYIPFCIILSKWKNWVCKNRRELAKKIMNSRFFNALGDRPFVVLPVGFCLMICCVALINKLF